MFLLDPYLIHKAMQNSVHKRLSSLVHVDGMTRDRANFDIDHYVKRDMARSISDVMLRDGFIQPKRDYQRETENRKIHPEVYPTEIHKVEVYVFTPDELFLLLQNYGQTLIDSFNAKQDLDKALMRELVKEELLDEKRREEKGL